MILTPHLNVHQFWVTDVGFVTIPTGGAVLQNFAPHRSGTWDRLAFYVSTTTLSLRWELYETTAHTEFIPTGSPVASGTVTNPSSQYVSVSGFSVSVQTNRLYSFIIRNIGSGSFGVRAVHGANTGTGVPLFMINTGSGWSFFSSYLMLGHAYRINGIWYGYPFYSVSNDAMNSPFRQAVSYYFRHPVQVFGAIIPTINDPIQCTMGFHHIDPVTLKPTASPFETVSCVIRRSTNSSNTHACYGFLSAPVTVMGIGISFEVPSGGNQSVTWCSGVSGHRFTDEIVYTACWYRFRSWWWSGDDWTVTPGSGIDLSWTQKVATIIGRPLANVQPMIQVA